MDRKDAVNLFRTYSKTLYNTALRITASSVQSEEIMQETILRLLTRGPKFSAEGQKAKWLKTTCIRMSIDWLRRQKRMVPIEQIDDGAALEETSEEHHSWDILGPDAVGIVKEEISRLPDGYRTVLVLKAIEDYSYPEIASMLGITETGARSQYMRAKRKVLENVLKRCK